MRLHRVSKKLKDISLNVSNEINAQNQMIKETTKLDVNPCGNGPLFIHNANQTKQEYELSKAQLKDIFSRATKNRVMESDSDNDSTTSQSKVINYAEEQGNSTQEQVTPIDLGVFGTNSPIVTSFPENLLNDIRNQPHVAIH